MRPGLKINRAEGLAGEEDLPAEATIACVLDLKLTDALSVHAL